MYTYLYIYSLHHGPEHGQQGVQRLVLQQQAGHLREAVAAVLPK